MNMLRWFRERKSRKNIDKAAEAALSVCAVNPNIERQRDLIEVCQSVLDDPDDSSRLALLVMQIPLLGVLGAIADSGKDRDGSLSRSVQESVLTTFDFGPNVSSNTIYAAFGAMRNSLAPLLATNDLNKLGNWLLSAASESSPGFYPDQIQDVGVIAEEFYRLGHAASSKVLS